MVDPSLEEVARRMKARRLQRALDYVPDYCKTERQWPRYLRIAHAEFQMKRFARDDVGRAFWAAVLQANKG